MRAIVREQIEGQRDGSAGKGTWRICGRERTDTCKLSFDLHVHAVALVPASIHIFFKINKSKCTF